MLELLKLAQEQKNVIEAIKRASIRLQAVPITNPTGIEQATVAIAVRRANSLVQSVCAVAQNGALWDAGVLVRTMIDLAITTMWMDEDKTRCEQLQASGREQLRGMLQARKEHVPLAAGEERTLKELAAECKRERQKDAATIVPKPCGCKRKARRADIAPEIAVRAKVGSPRPNEGDGKVTYDFPFKYWSQATHSSFILLRAELRNEEDKVCEHVLHDALVAFGMVLRVGALVFKSAEMQSIVDESQATLAKLRGIDNT